MRSVLIASFPAGPLAANCYVLATGPGAECVVVDPGTDALGTLERLVAEHDLRPAGVVATHGHLDHVGALTATCRRYAVPCWIRPEDRFMLTDPLAALLPEMHALVAPPGRPTPVFEEPEDVRSLDLPGLDLAGLHFDLSHAPGHTEGSAMLRTSYPPDDQVDSLLLSGDVLFAGSVGRTDLPGGSAATMLTTLRREVLPLPDTVVVLPGHGAQTTVGRERATNPYLS